MNSSESLAAFLESAGSGGHFRVEADLGGGYYRLRVDEAERRQAAQDIRSSEDVVIEMMRNSRDAHARNIFVATSKERSRRSITVIDDGDGIPPDMHELVFEPRVTSKLDSMNFDAWGIHGRGMALFSIAQNSLSACVASSDRGLGASIAVVVDTDALSERTDQSTFPAFVIEDDGSVLIRGPKNICRTVCEFALEQRSSLSVFLGSTSEIASSLYAYGNATLPARLRAFAPSDEDVPVCKRLALAADDADFAQRAESIGLPLSRRTARRILDGDIVPAPTMLERVEKACFVSKGRDACARKGSHPSASSSSSLSPLTRTKIEQADLDVLSHAVSDAFETLADAYYLDSHVTPKISVTNGEIRISIPIARIR